jgi:tRNA nucleotidyltransferase (CCA-adding enzyme)
MQIYLVGGAVRDELLGLKPTERDWVVVGAHPDRLRDQGYRQVGKDFPVFLHPETGEEYALARTERKTGPGYHGFSFHAAPDVTLEQDLARRDLTINAMARTEDGRLIDPFGGRNDLDRRLLRHVSPAFAEDPVRILRVARFAARYAGMGFGVAPETEALMHDMVTSGEVAHLVPERVWAETARALCEPEPGRYIQVLRDCGALARVLPEIDRLFGVPQPARHHPEIDCGAHLLLCLAQAARLDAPGPVRFAVLVHDLGKGTTPTEMLPAHSGHEARGMALIDSLCDRLRVPNDYRNLALLVAEYHNQCHRALSLAPEPLLAMLEAADAFRRPERLDAFLLACEADARGRAGLESVPYPQADRVRRARDAAAAIGAAPFVRQGLTGPAVGEAIRRGRVQAIAAELAEPDVNRGD